MEPWVDDLADDLQSMSFNSTTTSTTTDIHRSTSSGSDWTSSSAYFPPSSTVKPYSSTTPSSDPCWDSIRLFPSPTSAFSTASAPTTSAPST
ncbi:Protein kinase superfamily protein [Perilla frutescens var. hirtella]|nr:Protein kinase superfamily protein [Perilla frutescens var. hirtella]